MSEPLVGCENLWPSLQKNSFACAGGRVVPSKSRIGIHAWFVGYERFSSVTVIVVVVADVDSVLVVVVGLDEAELEAEVLTSGGVGGQFPGQPPGHATVCAL